MNFHIGKIEISPPLLLAPMAGITDLPFRLTVKSKGGCGLVYTEMISANALIRNHKRTYRLLDSDPKEQPVAVQIFGSDPQVMAEAGRIVEDEGADILDINMGCPVKKVIKTGAGSALMRSPGKVASLIKAVRDSISIPLTVKIRAGWDAHSINAVEMAQILEDYGVDAITLHPRTRSQGFSGKADWDLIGMVKEKVSLPVIGNGDISCPEDAQQMFCQSGCDAVMIGRAVRGNPWIFRQVERFLETCRENFSASDPHLSDKIEAAELHQTMLSHLQLLVDRIGETRATHLFKKHAAWYVRGYSGAAHFRAKFFSCQSYDELLTVINNFFP
jgi:nifR3 family TIM-barrel protein